jgi:hypothetical protein
LANATTGLKAMLLGGCALWALAAHASVTQVRDIETLTQDSDAVVRGTVQSVASSWVGEGSQKSIVTRVKIRVSEKLKGDPGSVAEVVQPGGVIPESDIGQIVNGMPEFQRGEEVIVFLRRHAPSVATFRVSGMAQGKYTVERTSDGKTAFAVPSAIDAALVGADGLPAISSAKPLELTELRKRIQAAVTK